MKRKDVAVIAVLTSLVCPLSGFASDYQAVSKQAEQQARWGLLAGAVDSYRQVLANPDLSDHHDQARLRLARLYMDSFDYAAARAALQPLLSRSSDSAEAKQARKLERKLASKTKTHSVGGKLQLGLVHDTDTANASASSPVADPVFLDDDEEGGEAEDDAFEDDADFADLEFEDDMLDDILEDVDLDEDDLEDSGLVSEDDDEDVDPGTGSAPSKRSVHDNRRLSTAAMRYAYGFNSRGDRWLLSGNFSQARQDDQTQLNRQTWAVSTGPEFLLPEWRLKLNPSVTYLQLYKDHHYDLSSSIWSMGVSHKINRVLEVGARYNYENRSLYSDDSPDVEVDTLKLSAKLKPTSHDTLDLSFSPKVEDNDQRKKDKDQHGWKLAYARKLPWDSFATVAFSRRHTDYDNDPKGKQEDEDKYAVSLGHKLTKQLQVAVSYEHKDKDSNQPGKDKNNESTALTVTYRF